MRLISDEQDDLLTESARDFARATTPIARLRQLRDSNDPLGFSRDVWRQMAELGWLGICLPEEYGGSSLGLSELVRVLEQLGRRLVPEPILSTVLLGAPVLLAAGTNAQKETWLARIARGGAIVSLAHEEGVHFAPDRIAARAEQEGDGFVITGQKTNVLDGSAANALLVSANTSEGPTLFLVNPELPGVRVERLRRIDSRGAAIVRLDAVRVGDDCVIGQPGRARATLEPVLDRAAVGLSAEMLGGAVQVFEDTLEYLKTRRQFDVPIGSFQALQHRAAKLYIELSLARTAVVAAARVADDAPDDLARLASLAKARCSDVFAHATNEAIQMHGGIGVTDEYHLGFYVKRARVAAATLGDGAYHRRRWAELGGY